jgi:hypothetical protein
LRCHAIEGSTSPTQSAPVEAATGDCEATYEGGAMNINDIVNDAARKFGYEQVPFKAGAKESTIMCFQPNTHIGLVVQFVIDDFIEQMQDDLRAHKVAL